jgi:integrase/recombinase XerC
MDTSTPTDPRTELVGAWLGGHVIRTQMAYRQALAHYAAWRGSEPAEAVADLLEAGAGGANARALAYRTAMTEAGLSPATIAQRLAALRSLVKLARTLGLVAWAIEIASPKVVAYRDTRGPGADGVRAMLVATDDARDRAIIRCLYDLALRRGELVCADYPADLDLHRGTIAVRGKGRHDKEPMTLPEPTKSALRAWLRERGDGSGPLFLNRDRARKGGGRLSGHSVARIIGAAGRRAGLDRHATPHGLRHAGITAALDAGVDVRQAVRFSRHADPRVLLNFYDDRRRDDAGAIAAIVAEGLE